MASFSSPLVQDRLTVIGKVLSEIIMHRWSILHDHKWLTQGIVFGSKVLPVVLITSSC